MRSSPVVSILLVAVTTSTASVAAERLHTVVYGESASAIAFEYYGDYDLADLLLRFNRREGSQLHPGEKLRVPYCTTHRVEPGDTGSELAKRHLGRASAWPTIAALNGRSSADPLRVGERLVMPVVLEYALRRGDSLAGLSARYYGKPSFADVLQSFNGIEDPRGLAVGQTIAVPIVRLRLVDRPPPTAARTRSKPAAKSASRNPVTSAPDAPRTGVEGEGTEGATAPVEGTGVAPEATTPVWFAEGLDAAERAYDDGEYESANERIDTLTARASEIPRADDRARMWRLNAFVEVAFDRRESACAAYRSMVETGSTDAFDPSVVSPKILELFESCQTALSTE